MKTRPTELIVNIQSIINNYNKIQELQPDKKILPVLKADGYGIGLEAVKVLIDKLKLDVVGTATVDEGIELRDNLHYNKDIIVLNQPSIEEIQNIVNYNITVGCCYIEFLETLDKTAETANKKAKVHIEIETGMGRTGVQEQNLASFIDKAITLNNIEIEGLYTHFATSDTDLTYTREQINKFENTVEFIKSKISTIKCVHCGNSGAILQINNLPGNMIRPGIMLYGYYPDENLKSKVELYPSSILKSKVTFIKEVEKDTSIGYGRTYITNKRTKIANVPIGYADGISRSLSNKGNVVLNGKLAPIVGTVCMDSLMIDVTNIDNTKIDDEVYIWDNKNITVEQIAKECDTINYEILTRVSNRVIRKIV